MLTHRRIKDLGTNTLPGEELVQPDQQRESWNQNVAGVRVLLTIF